MPSLRTAISFRPDDRLMSQIDERADAYQRGRASGRGALCERDLERYYALLATELHMINLSQQEWLALLDNVNGTLWETHSLRLLWANVEDGLANGLAARWGIDGPALVKKLRAMTAGQDFALVDALERLWKRDEASMEERLAALGLT